MKQKIQSLRFLCVLAAAALLQTGCMVIAGEQVEEPRATLGAELIDLQKARDAGVITEDEFREQRKKLFGRETPNRD